MNVRRTFVIASVIVCALILLFSYYSLNALYSFILIAPLIFMGISDMLQQKHSIKRNFPLIGRMRYVLETIRPEIYQYFIE